jgi:predicted LPLAT superfamily acyltransferase
MRRGGGAWYAREERGSILGIRIGVWLYRRLGRGIAALLLYPIVGYFFLTDAPGRRASRRYLDRLYASPGGARALGSPPGARHVFRHFLEFGVTILDRVGFWLGGDADFEFTVHGREHLDHLVEEERGALILGAHLGSFDVMRLLASKQSPLRVHLLMYTRHATRINQVLRALRRSSSDGELGVHVIPIAPGSFQHVIEAKAGIERGEVIAVLADRVPPGQSSRISPVDFLGGKAPLPQGPMRLAAVLGCPVLLMTGLRTGSRSYEIHVERFADRVELSGTERCEALRGYCQAYADRLAGYCMRAPYQWFNFFDFWVEGESRAEA